MKLKRFLLPLIAFAMSFGFTGCDDDDDNSTEVTKEVITDILCKGGWDPEYASKPNYGSGTHDYPHSGWMIQGHISGEDFAAGVKVAPEDLAENEYNSKVTPGKFTVDGYFIEFNRDFSFRMFIPDGEDLISVNGSWSLNGTDNLVIKANVNDKTYDVDVRIEKCVANYVLLYLTWPETQSPAYYELFWNENFKETKPKK